MDNLSLEALYRELKPRLLQKSIRRIRLGSARTIILGLHARLTEFLVVSLQSSYPVAFLTQEDTYSEASADSEGNTTDWLLTLRKYLTGGKIVDVRKEFADRILFLEIGNNRLAYRAEKLTLVLELIPTKANALLLKENQEVLSSFPAIQEPSGGEENLYKPPSLKSPYAIDRITKEEFMHLFRSSDIPEEGTSSGILAMGLLPPTSPFRSPQSAVRNPKISPFWSKLAGIGPVFVREIRFGGANDPELLWGRLQVILDRVRNGPYSPRTYFLTTRYFSTQLEEFKPSPDSGVMPRTASGQGRGTPGYGVANKPVVTPFPLNSLSAFQHQAFQSMNEACEEAYRLICTGAAFRNLQHSLVSRVQASLNKKNRLMEHLRSDLRKYQEFEVYKKYADLLYAQTDKSAPGQSLLRVVDLFDPNQSEIDIPLSPQFSVIQNANRYSKLYQKANRSRPLIRRRMKELEHEIALLESEQERLVNAENMEDLEKAAEARNQQPPLGIQRGSPMDLDSPRGHGARAYPPDSSRTLERKIAKSFISSDGLKILVGKSSKDNDALTLKVAKRDDFWFHIAGYGGSHVVLKNPEKLMTPPRQSLLEAAQLAAYFSQARNAPKVEVHYTQKKFVSKPKGAKPGLVSLKEYKSISVRPQLLTESEAS
jgi:predicted ribosome quality control (RQC) complex YloA/Tae2 family protein